MINRRMSLLGIIRGLMLADNLGDVHEEILRLCDLAGVDRPDGGYQEGWSASWIESEDED
jgi:hypothetical protein